MGELGGWCVLGSLLSVSFMAHQDAPAYGVLGPLSNIPPKSGGIPFQFGSHLLSCHPSAHFPLFQAKRMNSPQCGTQRGKLLGYLSLPTHIYFFACPHGHLQSPVILPNFGRKGSALTESEQHRVQKERLEHRDETRRTIPFRCN